MKSLSSEAGKNDNWSLLTSQSLEVYQTREFEDAKSIAGEEDEFKALDFFGDTEEESFQPIIQGEVVKEEGIDLTPGVPEAEHPAPAHQEVSNAAEAPAGEAASATVEVQSAETPAPETQDDGFEQNAQPPAAEQVESPAPSEPSSPMGSKLDAVALIVEEEKKAAYEKGLQEGLAKGREEAKLQFETENNEIREEEKKLGFEEGKSSGYEAGKLEALEEGKREFQEKLDMISGVVDSMGGSWDGVVSKYEEEIINLSMQLAKRVVYSNLTLDGNIVKLSIQQALKDIPSPMEITIGVNPDDYNIIEMIKEDFFQRFESIQNITIISDPSIGRGGCRIDSESGGITQTIENRLNTLEETLLQTGMKKNY